MYFFVVLALTAIMPTFVHSHGRLIEPPSRASMWRFGFNTPINYDDNQLFCGGFYTQWYRNAGRCGICGDSFQDPEPRNHEAGGKYATGIISRSYKCNDVIPVKVQLTANHMGWFEFRLCPNDNFKKDPNQDCLDQNLLEFADGSGTRYHIPNNFGSSGIAEMHLRLSKNVTCSQCVLQWHYNTASNWGICKDGVGRLGCGIQETFRGCADVEIKG